MTVPAVVPSAAIAGQTSASTARGERSRGQSTVREGSTLVPPERGGGWSWLVSARACVIAVRHYAETPTRLILFSVAPVTSSTVRVIRSGGQFSRQRSAISDKLVWSPPYVGATRSPRALIGRAHV